jgi:hypothetical protein
VASCFVSLGSLGFGVWGLDFRLEYPTQGSFNGNTHKHGKRERETEGNASLMLFFLSKNFQKNNCYPHTEGSLDGNTR